MEQNSQEQPIIQAGGITDLGARSDGIGITNFYREARRGGMGRIEATHRALDARGSLAWALKDVGWLIVQCGNRMLSEEQTTLDAEFAAGYRVGKRAGRRNAAAVMS